MFKDIAAKFVRELPKTSSIQFNAVFPEQEEMDRVDDLNPTSKEDFLGCTYVSKG